MTNLSKFAAVCALIAVSACTNQSEDWSDSGGAGTNPGTAVTTPGVSNSTQADPTSAAYFKSTIGDRVLFLVDEATLTSEAKTVLGAQANWLKQNGVYTARIEGHADEQGTREYNLALGARRANAVREYLVAQGVPAGRLQVVSFGKERPIEICSEESCYAKNRRAVTVLATGLTG